MIDRTIVRDGQTDAGALWAYAESLEVKIERLRAENADMRNLLRRAQPYVANNQLSLAWHLVDEIDHALASQQREGDK